MTWLHVAEVQQKNILALICTHRKILHDTRTVCISTSTVCTRLALVVIAVGITWPHHLAVFATRICVLQFETRRSELVSLAGIGTGTAVCAGYRWV